ncbi:MAG: ribosome assembly cofactor RimP [Dysgonamonadaceae bacterium]|nr:ribosome assembly cofactor RimP [Dysgonamonadaceae bacterium]
MISKTLVESIVNKYLENSDIYLVNVEVKPENIIIVEIDHDKGVHLEDCIRLNKFIESQLDRNIEDFELEVGSAGISQALKMPRQYQKNIGHEVEVLTKDGRKLYGILQAATENTFTLTVEKQVKPEGAKRKITVTEDLSFAYNEVKYTKYKF